MAASASFCLEDGMDTSSCIAVLALRMRVSMSAIGSVMVMVATSSPARLGHARDLPGVDHVAQADPAELELAVHRVRTAALLATRVGPDLELGLAVGLVDESLLGHGGYCPSRLNGKPKASSRALPSALVRGVVTMVMSMPRVVSTLS